MNKSSTHHIIDAIKLGQRFYLYPLALLLIGIVIYLPVLFTDSLISQASIVLRIILFVILVVIHGHLIEIIMSKERETWTNIIKQYFPKIFILGLLLSMLMMVIAFSLWGINKSIGNQISFRPLIYLGKFLIKVLI